MGIKISELESTTTANANDVFIINQNGATKKITKENLENEIINPELEERVDDLEEEVENLQTKVTDLEETVNSELEDGTAEGTEITVNDSAVADANLLPNGNTEQTQYEGYNLLPNNGLNTWTHSGITFKKNEDKSVTINGTSTGYIDYYLYGSGTDDGNYLEIPRGTYTLSYFNSNCLWLAREKTAGAVVGNSSILSLLSERDCQFYGFSIRVEPNKTINNATEYPQLVLGSTTKPYEPFVGGQASPSPDYPQDIHVLKGSNAIKISNKNKIKISTTNRTLSGVTITNNNNEDVTLNGTATATSGGLSLLSSNTDYPIADLPRILTFCVKDSLPTGVELAMAYGTSTGGWISNIIVLNPNKKMESISLTNIPSNAEFVRFNFTVQSGTVLNNVVVKPMILDGIYTATTLPEYEPHKEITKTLTLPSGLEMCKADDCKDEFVKDLSTGKWYKDEKISKVIFDGTETFVDQSNGAYATNISDKYSRYGTDGLLCSHYSLRTGTTTSNYFGIDNDTTRVRFWNVGKTLSDFKTWLSTHNVELYYQLATPQLIEITDETLIEELDELLEIRTYFGQTNITVEAEDAKPYMTLNYKKSNRILRSEIDTIKARLDLLEN